MLQFAVLRAYTDLRFIVHNICTLSTASSASNFYSLYSYHIRCKGLSAANDLMTLQGALRWAHSVAVVKPPPARGANLSLSLSNDRHRSRRRASSYSLLSAVIVT